MFESGGRARRNGRLRSDSRAFPDERDGRNVAPARRTGCCEPFKRSGKIDEGAGDHAFALRGGRDAWADRGGGRRVRSVRYSSVASDWDFEIAGAAAAVLCNLAWRTFQRAASALLPTPVRLQTRRRDESRHGTLKRAPRRPTRTLTRRSDSGARRGWRGAGQIPGRPAAKPKTRRRSRPAKWESR